VMVHALRRLRALKQGGNSDSGGARGPGVGCADAQGVST
jgi:hypothetical protein